MCHRQSTIYKPRVADQLGRRSITSFNSPSFRFNQSFLNLDGVSARGDMISYGESGISSLSTSFHQKTTSLFGGIFTTSEWSLDGNLTVINNFDIFNDAPSPFTNSDIIGNHLDTLNSGSDQNFATTVVLMFM
ncbi:hypothetical protein EYS14_04735 [Alteromonadaceae bacterium M269]|nr:hypothetical protein EYS14_04735 [Alteromonadaceae bacterium M269]